MDTRSRPTPEPALKQVVVPREHAVFWMDGRGHWHNRHGRFEHKRIIDHFIRAIRRDGDGYYVTQVRGDICEKVYFPFEDTPLFVVRIIPPPPLRLHLNTGREIPLDPAGLYVEADHIYLRNGDERIKFAERALLALAPYLQEGEEGGLQLSVKGSTWPIPERSAAT
ncbi:MAG TPA: MFS transporter permease [Desulfosarcina sp.]|nr:MFS transporter permease [Desulfosarcina sp.]